MTTHYLACAGGSVVGRAVSRAAAVDAEFVEGFDPGGLSELTAGAVSAPAISSERIVIAIRRFFALPSAVALSATGRNSP